MIKAMTKYYVDFLEKEGMRPVVKGEDIAFQFQEKVFLLLIDHRDQQFFRLLMPNFWLIASETERQKAYQFASEVTSEVKVGKIIISGNRVHASAEMLTGPEANPNDFFLRVLQITKETADRFAGRMMGLFPGKQGVPGWLHSN